MSHAQVQAKHLKGFTIRPHRCRPPICDCGKLVVRAMTKEEREGRDKIGECSLSSVQSSGYIPMNAFTTFKRASRSGGSRHYDAYLRNDHNGGYAPMSHYWDPPMRLSPLHYRIAMNAFVPGVSGKVPYTLTPSEWIAGYFRL